MKLLTHSPEETERLGMMLGGRLRSGDVVACYGGLGAGKTAFTRGVAQGLDVKEAVTSPTYTLVNEYLTGRLPIFHFDLYRLSSEDELFEIGWEDYQDRDGVCCVEWSENAEGALDGAIRVTLRPGPSGPEEREIEIEGGERFANLSL